MRLTPGITAAAEGRVGGAGTEEADAGGTGGAGGRAGTEEAETGGAESRAEDAGTEGAGGRAGGAETKEAETGGGGNTAALAILVTRGWSLTKVVFHVATDLSRAWASPPGMGVSFE
jgi:hypothetical protein